MSQIQHPDYVVEVAPGEEYFAEDFDRVHCRHGHYVGYPGGADYMCPACEMGWDTLYTYYRYYLRIEWVPGDGFRDAGTFSRVSDVLPFLALAWAKGLCTQVEVEELKDWGPSE